jgi:Raf kinase inhibitor-like YbhB/YbcL family protein
MRPAEGLVVCKHVRIIGLAAALIAVSLTVVIRTLASAAGGNMAFSISSSDFQNGGDIPKKFTCDGADGSPELSWSELPAGTQTLALIADDPDAPGGTFTHWVLFNLPAAVSNLGANVSKVDELPNGARQGRNGFRKIGYGGPCPPPGKPHRYFFKLYALDQKLDLRAGASKEELEKAMAGHTLAKAEIVGKYGR